MAGPLTADLRAEIAALSERYGAPLHHDATISGGFADPIRRHDRVGEVCMVIRRPGGSLLLSTKTFYPPGAYRLPTGGIRAGERIEAALLRETREETGLETAVRRFLALVSYRARGEAAPLFHTFAFLLDELGGTLGSLDPAEEILAYREVAIADLPAVARALAAVGPSPSERIDGDWRDWGRFRAVVHGVVHEALTSAGDDGGRARG
ncbi:MAG TPA: NUDIX hydrolase [Candidatus Limnocylindrales bacterium]|nr:NUDIX hydrolase [Candidatus Limnocylindrales bacterium]